MAEKAVDEGDDELILCSLMLENEKEKVKQKVWFKENVKLHWEAGMLCTIDGETSYLFIRNMWIRDSGSNYKVIEIHKFIQGILGCMPTIKGELCIKVKQVDGNGSPLLASEVLSQGR